MSDYLNFTVVASTALAVSALYALQQVVPVVYHRFVTPLRFLPGPPGDHWFFGNAQAIMKADNSVLQEAWVEQFGPTITYQGLFGVCPHSYFMQCGELKPQH